ncbi:MAG: helix-turn-helix domain-containing protein [Bacteriovoracaceae bacterium]|jgi:transcriptional regulator with XRE-family HTH domain|nr:helix-turn-helix domain-containing protein [Bacteriovoracaceae bacterium]
MIKFNQDYTEMFLGVVRKYMQIRGGLSQKELAEKLEIGISTMSRFLNQKTKEMDPQLIAMIVAKLAIPLHEIIDFIAEESTSKFKHLVNFYKEQKEEVSGNSESMNRRSTDSGVQGQETTRTMTSAKVGGVNVAFGEKEVVDKKDLTIKEKLGTLSPRQKGFLTDFLDMDTEGRDLIVDLGNSIFRYFSHSKAKF